MPLTRMKWNTLDRYCKYNMVSKLEKHGVLVLNHVSNRQLYCICIKAKYWSFPENCIPENYD